MDKVTITVAEHATYVAAMAEVETLRRDIEERELNLRESYRFNNTIRDENDELIAKLATCRVLITLIEKTPFAFKVFDGIPTFQAAKEACK